jgi:hypothetical protein
LIERVIDSSDYYLLLIGGRYGSIHPETDLSFTEMEYDYAVKQKTPVMAFLHRQPEDLPVKKSDIDEELRAKLAKFRRRVEADHAVNYWTSAAELAGEVALTFADSPT